MPTDQRLPAKLTSLELACDARLQHPDYVDDHIWEIRVGGGEPPAISAATTYGLRARQMRLFPRFCRDGRWLSDPSEFAEDVHVQRCFPNYAAVLCTPYPSIDVELEFWVPESHLLCGRIHLTNHTTQEQSIDLELAAQLILAGKGEAIAIWEQVVSPVLKGETEGLYPVLFMTGGPAAGSGTFPALMLHSTLQPAASRVVTWALATCREAGESFEQARLATARNWEAELTRITRTNASHAIEINSGNPEWDTIFALSQKAARSLVMGPEAGLPYPSFVSARRPDNGYSPKVTGTDYQHLWNGQAPLSAYYLSMYALPADLEFRRQLVMNFLATQASSGDIDNKPGLAGQRSRMQAAPFLCQLAWNSHAPGDATAWLEEVFDPLYRYLQAWFKPTRDRDGDGLPEWDHLQQMAFEDHPTFSRAENGGEGLEIHTAEDPALLTLLYLECKALQKMAGLQGDSTSLAWLEEIAKRLKEAVETSWDADSAAFLLQDRDLHKSTHGSILGTMSGSGRLVVTDQDDLPARLLIHIKAATENTRNPRINVHGERDGQEASEEITARSVFWVHNQAWITTEGTFERISEVELHGLDPRDDVSISTADLTRISLASFLPLLAGLATPDQVERMVSSHLANPAGFALPYGMPVTATKEDKAAGGWRTCLPWNALIIEGLLESGQPVTAADLFRNMMEGIRNMLLLEGRFQGRYNALTGQPGGDANMLGNLAPVGLYLKLAGISIYTPQKVFIGDGYPFDDPITVQYQGIEIRRSRVGTTVIFADGQAAEVPATGSHLVCLPEH